MKRLLFFFSFLFISVVINGQIEKPVHWNFSLEHIKGKDYYLVFSATIDSPWHMYATDIPEGGPIATSFHYSGQEGFKLVDTLQELSKKEVKFDPNFNMNIGMFAGKAVFRQRIELISDNPITIKGYVEFMACNDNTCLAPEEIEFAFNLPQNAASEDSEKTSGSLWALFFTSLLAGFTGLLTPCVYPMIPMTVSFFMRGQENRAKSVFNALIFGTSIVLIYTSLGGIVSLTGSGSDLFQTISTHWLPNLIFFSLVSGFCHFIFWIIRTGVTRKSYQ